MSYPKDPRKLNYGWLEQKEPRGSRWTKYWVVLKEKTLYLYDNDDTRSESSHQKGRVILDKDTHFKVGETDRRKGEYKFEISTSRHTNKFKCWKQADRDLWRAYIVGLVTGILPSKLDLPEITISKVLSDIKHVEENEKRGDIHTSTASITKDTHNHSDVRLRSQRISEASFDSATASGRSSESDSTGTFSGSAGSHSGGAKSRHRSDSGVEEVISPVKGEYNGGPFMNHRFSRNPQEPYPKWFFEREDRTRSEEILKKCHPTTGNTLMRLSSKFRDDGSYVISKTNRGDLEHPFEHFEVMRLAEGYKINVVNEHKPMPYLKDVMDYFISASEHTIPLKTNNLREIGVHDPYETEHDYRAFIEQQKASSGAAPDLCKRDAMDYLEPVSEKRSSVIAERTKNMSGHQTWTGQNIPRSPSDTKSFVGGQTVAVPKQPPRSSIRETFAGSRETASLDEVIGQYDDVPGTAPPPPPIDTIPANKDVRRISLANPIGVYNEFRSSEYKRQKAQKEDPSWTSNNREPTTPTNSSFLTQDDFKFGAHSRPAEKVSPNRLNQTVQPKSPPAAPAIPNQNSASGDNFLDELRKKKAAMEIKVNPLDRQNKLDGLINSSQAKVNDYPRGRSTAIDDVSPLPINQVSYPAGFNPGQRRTSCPAFVPDGHCSGLNKDFKKFLEQQLAGCGPTSPTSPKSVVQKIQPDDSYTNAQSLVDADDLYEPIPADETDI